MRVDYLFTWQLLNIILFNDVEENEVKGADKGVLIALWASAAKWQTEILALREQLHRTKPKAKRRNRYVERVQYLSYL